MTRPAPDLHRPSRIAQRAAQPVLARVLLGGALVAGVVALPPAAAPVAAGVPALQDDRELDEILAAKAQEAEAAELEAIWRSAREVAILLGDEVGPRFDAAVDRALGAERGPRSTLFLLAARLEGEEVDWTRVAEALSRVLASEDAAAIAGAADLVGSAADAQQQDADVREKIGDDLLALAQDGSRTPEQRVQCAVAAHRIGLGAQRDKSRTVLYAFLESTDPYLRARGALGLAGLGVIEGIPQVENELDRLALTPGEDGRLASAYLKQLQIRRYYETEMRRARKRMQEMVGQGAMGSDLERMERLIALIERYHLDGDKVTREDLLESALDGMLRDLDRHSAYFSPEAYKRFEQDLEAEYGGIGAYVGEDPDDGLFTITRPIYSGPAYEAGLSSDDKIVRIEDWPTIGEEETDIIKKLKGRPGTTVKLYVWRKGMDPSLIERPSEDMAIEIRRDTITIPPVHSELLPGGIGLVELTTFSRVASQELEKHIRELMDGGMRALVFDLRNNTGGLLTEATNVADLFLPAGKAVVSTESRLVQPRTYETRQAALVPEDMPVVVLINRFSASASEIVSGALQDHGRATLVGQRSYGKGSVQNLIRMPGEEDDDWADENRNGRFDDYEKITKDHDGDGEFDYAPRIKLTIERYRLPTGRSIHREVDESGNIVSDGGVNPEVEVGPTRREQWRLIEMRKLQDTRALRDWAREQFETHADLFAELAYADGSDWSAYPGFDELYGSLDTVLSKEDVRFLLRMEVRRLVQDARGHAFPFGDFEEDVQLQAAIEHLLGELGGSVEEIPAFASTFDEVGEDGIVRGSDLPLGLTASDLDEALALIAEAEGGDAMLTREKLRELSELIRAKRKN